MMRFDVPNGQNFTREELFLIELCVEYILGNEPPACAFRRHFTVPSYDDVDVFDRVKASVMEKIATDFAD